MLLAPNGKQSNLQDLISQGVVELKIFATKPEHAKEYGLDSVNPLYVQSLCITENQRLKGIGNKVLQYIDDYAIKNGHDLVFGHITQNAEFTKDNREIFFCDTDMIKNWLHSKGYAIQTHNNDFHKVINNDIRFDKGGEIKIDGNIFKVKIYLGDHSYDRETNKETPMWFCRVIKMNGNDVDGILSEDNDLEGADIGAFDSRKKAKDFLLKYSEELNVILLDDYSIGVNVFSNNSDIQYKKGGMTNKGYVSYKDRYNTKYGYSKGESHDLEEISKDTGVSIKGLQQIYNKGIGAYKTNPSSVRPNVKSKEQWAMARVYSSVMGGKASKIDSNELKMENGGEVFDRISNIDKEKLIILNEVDILISEHKKLFANIDIEMPKSDAEKQSDKKIANLLSRANELVMEKRKLLSNELKMVKGGKINRGGDCYFIAGQFVLNNDFIKKIDFIGTPYLVHAEVQGQGAISHLRYGHAFIEDNVFVYDYSNNREIQLPKDYYYKIADIKTNNPKKYRKYTFKQAKEKMLETSKYGCWDLEVDYARGGDIKFNGANTSLALFQELSDKSFLFPKDTIYLWLYEGENAEQKLDNGEYDWVLYPFSSLNMMGQRGFVPPIKKIWTTKFQNKLKGADKLLGVIKAELINDGKGLYIDIMSVNPKRKKQGIMSYMIKYLRDTYNLSQEQIEFSNTTDDGRKFVAKKTYEQGGNIKNNNMSKYKDGLFVGKSHKEGGIPLVVKSTGQNIEVEGGEIITNKKSVADTKKRTLTGTNCEIISQINTQNGNGVAIDCDSVVGQKYEYGDGGKITKQKQNIKNQNMNENINFKNFKVRKPKIFNPTNSLGLKRSEMPQIRKQFLPILFEKLDNERIGYENLSVDAESLKPSQNEINKDFAKTFDQEQLYEKNVIVSSDNYIIDGHHRWYYCLIEDLPVKITRIDLPIHEALNFIRQLDFIEVDEIAKKGMLINNQRSLFGEGGNIEVDKYSKDIPLSIYKGVIGDFDNDNISNADDLEPNVPSNIKLEEISLKDEITDIVKYRNLFIDVQQKVLNEIKKINTCGKIQCEIKTRIKTPYSIINKLRRRSLTDVKTLDKLDKKAKEFLKNKNLKGIDLYKGLTDVLGFMVIVEDFNFLNKLKAEVEAGNLGEVLEFEDFYKNDLNGYRAYHFLLSTQVKGTFIPYELQIRTMRVNELARITHTLYKKGLMNDKENDKIAKQIEIADKGNKVIAKIIDKKLENKDLLKKELTSAKKLALGDFITDGWLSSYKYKVQNNKNKLYNTILGFGENEKEARKDLYKKYKDFTILSINGTPIKFFEDKKIDRSKINLKDAHSTFEYAREMKKGGVIYRDLSLIEPRMLRNDSTNTNNNVNEIDIIKTGETFPFHHKQIMTSNDSYELLKDFWNLNNLNVVEESNIIFLDKQNKPVYIYRHSKGGIDSTTADIEVICAIAVKTLSKGVIISHNHPSTNKNVKPSPADIEISKKLKNALKLFDIVLIDHIIVASEDGYYSMADEGVFKYGGNVVDTTQGSPYMKYISDIGKTIFVTKNKKEALSRLNSLKNSNDDYDQLFSYELMQVPYKDTIIGDYNDYRVLAKYKYASGGEVNSNCDCYECISYSETMLIDEAYTTKGNLFLVKLKGVFYLIYDGEIVLKSSELRYAKREFESYLFSDRLNAKNTFAKGGMITDAEYKSLEKIVPRRMLASIKETKESWERGDSDDVFEHYENLIEGYREIPKLYEQDGKGKNAVVYLHYFYGGSDWYITELDKETNQAFGYAILNGNTQDSELGYMNLNEFTDSIIDLDLYWSFQTLNEIFENEYPELVRGEIEYYNKDATITRLTNFELLIEKNDFKNQYEINKFIELMIDEKGVNVNNYTTTEQTYLLKYSGMGGLQKYGATGSGILWEYYTPKRVVDLMWGLAYKHRGTLGYDRVLENSVGIGNFVNACPLAVKQMDCYDISKYAIAICMIIYGKDERFNFINESFETLFFNGNTSVKDNVEPIYDLVIGNPPYSEYSGKYAGMGEKKYTKATNYIDYFIFRSLDLLKSGGILVYVLGSVKGMGQDNWIESKDNYTKEKIKEKADLIDAYRLGSGVFDYTDVDSDIIVLRKK